MNFRVSTERHLFDTASAAIEAALSFTNLSTERLQFDVRLESAGWRTYCRDLDGKLIGNLAPKEGADAEAPRDRGPYHPSFGAPSSGSARTVDGVRFHPYRASVGRSVWASAGVEVYPHGQTYSVKVEGYGYIFASEDSPKAKSFRTFDNAARAGLKLKGLLDKAEAAKADVEAARRAGVE